MPTRRIAIAIALMASLAVVSCASSPDPAPAPLPEPEPSASAQEPAPKDVSEPATPEPGPAQTPPASSDVPPPAATAPAVSRTFQASRFSVTLNHRWIEAPGAYQTDYGAQLSLIPEATADGRAIDIFREAIPIPAEAAAAATAQYWQTFQAGLAAGAVLTRQPDLMLGTKALSAGTITVESQPARIQHILLWISEDGIYTFVLTTRTTQAATDRAVLEQCAESFTFGNLEAVRAATRATLPFTYGRIKGWLLTVSGQRATLRAPVQAAPDGNGLLRGTTISVTTIGRAHPTPEAQATFARDLALSMVPPEVPEAEREEKTPVLEWGKTGGLSSAVMNLLPPYGGLAEGDVRRVVVVFGQQHTFTVSLNCPASRLDSALSDLAVFLGGFSEAVSGR